MDRRRLSADARLADPRRRLARRHLRRVARLLDRRRRRSALASALCAVAPNANTLIVFRGLQGIAGALLTPASLALITATFTGVARGAAIGTWTAWSGISTVIGPLLGGWLIGISSWRVIFLLNVPIAIGTLALALAKLPRHQHRKEGARVDFVGGDPLRRRARRHRARLHRAAATRLGRSSWSRAGSPAAPSCSPRSSSGRCAPRSRCCRCGSSACATSASRTSRRSPSTAGSRPGASSSRSSCSRSPATRRSAPGSRRCR